MGLIIWKIRLALPTLIKGEEGQDLVEYAIIVALMALGSVAGMSSVSNAINAVFTQLGNIMYLAFR